MMNIKKNLKKLLFVANCLNPFLHKKVDILKPDVSLKKLTIIHPKKETSVRTINTINPEYDLHIIIPTYNAGPFIEQCLDSIFNQQTTFTFFVTVVDDGSTDDTEHKIRKYEKLSNFAYVKQKNSGPSSARNFALKHIRGKFISFVDSDDMLDSNFIQKMLTLCNEKDADFVQCDLERFLKPKFKVINSYKTNFHVAKTSELQGFAGGFVCKSIFFQDICFPENYWFEDTLCCFALFPFMNKIYKIDEKLYKHRMTPTSFSSAANGNVRTLETIYITNIMLEEFPFHKNKLLINSEILRTQTICNISRISTLNFDLQISAFSIMFDVYKQMISKGLIIDNYFSKLILSKKYFLIKKYCRFH